MTAVPNPLRRALLLLTMALLPLRAQLDPKLQTSPSDILNLYQTTTGSSSSKLKPEILAVLDFSGSMNRVAFAAMYPINWPDEIPPFSNPGCKEVGIFITLGGGSGGRYIQSVSIDGYGNNSFTASDNDGSNPTTLSAGGTRILAKDSHGTSFKDANGNDIYTNTLIKPDGTELTRANVNAMVNDGSGIYFPGGTASDDVVNWIHCASHARIRCSIGSSKYRDVDIPLPWAVLDPSVRTVSSFPLPRLKVLNPASKGGDGAYYDVDTTYQSSSGSDQVVNRDSGTQAYLGLQGQTLFFGWRTRYLQWIFTATDASGNYYIPNAVPSGDAAVLKAVDADNVMFDPSVQDYRNKSLNTSVQPAVHNPLAYVNQAVPAWGNGLPGRTRIQAMKEAFIKTWFSYQDQVYLAFRFLYDGDGSTPDSTISIGASPGNNGYWTYLSSSTSTSTDIVNFAGFTANGSTHLTTTPLNAYAQMTNPDAFKSLETGLTNAQRECLQHFMIIFTDGAPYESPAPVEGNASNFPYTNGAASGNAAMNTSAKLSALDGGGNYWNLPTLAGVAAHGGDKTLGWIRDPSTAYTYTSSSSFAPFWVQKRNSSYTFAKPHAVQTMTVGISLGTDWVKKSTGGAWGTSVPDTTAKPMAILNDTTAGKFRLLMAAEFGDPASTAYTASTATEFYPADWAKPTSKANNAAYFFDARDPSSLVGSLNVAIAIIANQAGISTSSEPMIPFVGAGLGAQIYLTKFVPTASNNPVWQGDMFMFPTQQSGTSLVVKDKTGATVTQLDKAVPMWSADAALRTNRSWSARKVYTRLPNAASGLMRFTPFNDATLGGTATAFDDIKANLAPGALTTDQAKQTQVAFLLGADVSSSSFTFSGGNPNASTPNRSSSGDLLGDIINSSPAAVEYTLSSSIQTALPPKLAAVITAAQTTNSTCHFRVIYVGTNRGFLHAFGEVTYTDPNTKLVVGDVDELWAFMPTDFLNYIDYLNPNKSGQHYYCLDGTPYVYFRDNAGSTAITANQKLDAAENAVVVFGLRKGGRSYYAIDITDPFTPHMGEAKSGGGNYSGWALRADEAANLTSSNLDADALATTSLASTKTVVGKMGLSTCVPAVGRVLLGSTNIYVRDLLFLGGGYSTPEVDTSLGGGVYGRSAIALDILTGRIVSVWDLSGGSYNMGPVASGLVPFQYFLNSGLIQRVYFSDYKGGLWSLGSGLKNTAGNYVGFRRDTSLLNQWTTDGAIGSAPSVRKVYQDGGKVWRDATGPNNSIYSVRPAPFLIGYYPGKAKLTDTTGATFYYNPAAVGIALESGDRDNPLDRFPPYTSTTVPTQHRMTVVFDRQDSYRFGIDTTGASDSQLASITSSTVLSNTWLDDASTLSSTKLGYYMNFPAASGNFVPKGIYEPVVLNRVLFYAYFTPTSANCTGGSGTTNTVRVADVMAPTTPGNGVAAPYAWSSGQVASFTGLASPLAAMSTSVVGQAGIIPVGSTNALEVVTFEGRYSDKFPRVRTWRSVR